jgi:hypothetical protein
MMPYRCTISGCGKVFPTLLLGKIRAELAAINENVEARQP